MAVAVSGTDDLHEALGGDGDEPPAASDKGPDDQELAPQPAGAAPVQRVAAHRLRRRLPKSDRVVLVDRTPTTGTPRRTCRCSTAAERRSG